MDGKQALDEALSMANSYYKELEQTIKPMEQPRTRKEARDEKQTCFMMLGAQSVRNLMEAQLYRLIYGEFHLTNHSIQWAMDGRQNGHYRLN